MWSLMVAILQQWSYMSIYELVHRSCREKGKEVEALQFKTPPDTILVSEYSWTHGDFHPDCCVEEKLQLSLHEISHKDYRLDPSVSLFTSFAFDGCKKERQVYRTEKAKSPEAKGKRINLR